MCNHLDAHRRDTDDLAGHHPAGPTLSAWTDGECDPVTSAAIVRHLAGCPRCQSAADSSRALGTALRAWADDRPARVAGRAFGAGAPWDEALELTEAL